MAKVEAATVVVDIDPSHGHDHNVDVASIVETHIADGYTLSQAFYCNSSLNWPAHIMLIFIKA